MLQQRPAPAVDADHFAGAELRGQATVKQRQHARPHRRIQQPERCRRCLGVGGRNDGPWHCCLHNELLAAWISQVDAAPIWVAYGSQDKRELITNHDNASGHGLLGRRGGLEMNQGAREGVEDAHGVRVRTVRQDEEATGGGGDEVVVAEERQLPAEKAPGVGVDEVADAVAAGEHVRASGEEAGVGVGGGPVFIFILSKEVGGGHHFPVAVGRAGGGLEFIQHDPPGWVEALVVHAGCCWGRRWRSASCGRRRAGPCSSPGRWWRGGSRRHG